MSNFNYWHIQHIYNTHTKRRTSIYTCIYVHRTLDEKHSNMYQYHKHSPLLILSANLWLIFSRVPWSTSRPSKNPFTCNHKKHLVTSDVKSTWYGPGKQITAHSVFPNKNTSSTDYHAGDRIHGYELSISTRNHETHRSKYCQIIFAEKS